MPAAHPTPHVAGFDRTRYTIFGILLAGYVLSFFHRTAPAAIAGELTQTFSINSTVLGTLAATYFFVYTLLQIPVGVLADTMGPRRIVTAGALVAGAGSLLFGMAPTWEIAAVGRTLVGVGVAVTFIAMLKIIAVWFPANRFATLVGIGMFAGNLGAVFAGAPLAWLVTFASWRTVFVGLGLLSLALGIATWIVVRDTPEQRGYPPVHAAPPAATGNESWMQALSQVLANRATWPGFFVNLGVGGSFLAFAGLWAVPFLQQVYGMPRNVAAQHGSLVLLGVALGALFIGWLSDRLRNRRGVMRTFTVLYALSWAPWLLHWQPSLLTSHAWCFLMGLLIPGFVLNWTVAKEVNRPEHAGMATSVVNVGIFLGAGILQPLVGWVLDRGRAAGELAHAWDNALFLIAGSATFGALATLFVRETGKRAR
ncbi:MAG: MFS transporter [Betaproteobacteria bacterium]